MYDTEKYATYEEYMDSADYEEYQDKFFTALNELLEKLPEDIELF